MQVKIQKQNTKIEVKIQNTKIQKQNQKAIYKFQNQKFKINFLWRKSQWTTTQ